ncbi:MAG: MFS transporter [Candidatus Lokiarchaeota archaeon]|nr:MFS transporter [Candidatus Lokiarchaeota archaeon]
MPANESRENGAGPGVPTGGSMADYLSQFNIDPRKALFTLMLCTFIDQLGYTLILPLLPGVAKGFGVADLEIGGIIAANAATALVCGPVLGKLSDRFGRKRLLIISMLGTLASFTLLSLSTNLAGIIASRVLDGIFSGQIPIVRAYVADITGKRERTDVMGKMMASFSLGLIIGPSIGGLLGELDWRYPVIFGMVLSALGTALVFKILVESMPPQRVAEIKARKAASAALASQPNGFDAESLLTRPIAIRLVQIFLQVLAFNAFISTLPLVLEERFLVSPSQIGLLFSVFGIELIVFSGLALKRVLKRFGEAKLLVASIALLASSFVVYPFIDNFWLLFAFITPPTVAMALFRPIVQSTLTKAAPESRQGEANGWGTTMQGIAQVVAPLVSTSYLQAGSLLLFGITVSAYYLIGWTISAVFVALLIVAIIDVRLYPRDFEELVRPPVA